MQLLSSLLWAAYGMNRTDGGRTAASSALNVQEIYLFLALPSEAYRYDAAVNELHLVAANDLRRITSYQDFVDEAPLDLVYVADYTRMNRVPVEQRESYVSVAAGGYYPKCISVRCQQWVGYSNSRLDRPCGIRRCTRTHA